MASSVRVVVHLGPEKTGTTALAKYLTILKDQDQLPAELIYPAGELWFGWDHRIQKHRLDLQRVIHNMGDENYVAAEDDAVLQKLRSFALTQKAQQATVLLIAETSLVKIPPEKLTELLLRYFDSIDYVVAARNQVTGIRSLIAQRVRDLDDPAWSLAPQDYEGGESISFESMDYALVAERWSTTDPRVTLHFVPFFDTDSASLNMINRFLDAVKLPRLPMTKGIEGRRVHPTFSAEGMKKLSKIKHRMLRWGWVPGVKGSCQKQFEETFTVYHHAAANSTLEPSGKAFLPWNFSESDRKWVAQRFAESNRRFLAQVDRGGMAEAWERWSHDVAGGLT